MKFIEVSEEPGRLTAIVADKIESIEAQDATVLIRTVKYTYCVKCADESDALKYKTELVAQLREAK